METVMSCTSQHRVLLGRTRMKSKGHHGVLRTYPDKAIGIG